VASATASVVTQAIATNPQASIPVQSHSSRNAKAAEPESFDGNWEKTEEFIQAIRIAVAMQTDTFADERMKILYALSFMHGGTAQMWAANETTAIMDSRSLFHTLDKFLANIEMTFGDPDRARTACTQLHELKMVQGMMAEDYMAGFEMLAGRTGFNNEALKDVYTWGLPYLILQKVYAQTALPNSLDGWKKVVHNLDRLH